MVNVYYDNPAFHKQRKKVKVIKQPKSIYRKVPKEPRFSIFPIFHKEKKLPVLKQVGTPEPQIKQEKEKKEKKPSKPLISYKTYKRIEKRTGRFTEDLLTEPFMKRLEEREKKYFKPEFL